ncbi:LRR receptor-like serine/threonine-protein kinase EFR [Pistacia vera]|uniref:LRR receptor-like serine/threonine-protein kinase EFR n=1 Tax=Pistacia vera TaxID=55513 RepID=UPI001263229C|nr:LRR receptor-like serine/threonine-protein kinase EFR [Pistacia vera]
MMSRIVFCSVSFHLLLLFWSSLLSYGSVAFASSVFKGNETDRLALLEFKAKVTHDPLQVLSSWNDSNHFCQWEGVTCSRRHQRVNRLVLPDSKLEGSLLPSIGNLSFLRVLQLNNNSFHNEILHEIGHLFRLQFLGLENNSFGGEIPSNLSGCANLEWFTVGNNKMVGKVPGELGSLAKLRGLYLLLNNLSGEVPPSLGNLSSLVVLSASKNQFEGRIPATLGRLKRIQIIAFGENKLSVDYLHNHGQTPMVHCDLKPSNVLLDDELTAHVGDFGLARFLPEGTHSLSSNQTSSIGVRGTVGYAAPEYGMGSEVSTHGDVYSYGILLLEMFTGKRPTDEMFNGDLNLHDFVKAAIPERVIEIVDPILLQENEGGQTSLRSHSVQESLISIFGIGVTCSSRSPSERTNMDDVTSQLHSIKNKVLQTPRRGQKLL